MYKPKYQNVISGADAFYLSHARSKMKELQEQQAKILAEITEIQKNIVEIFENVDEPLYSVWYYTLKDIGNNGGTRTVINKDELVKLCESSNENDLFFVDVYDSEKEIFGKPSVFPKELDPYLNQIRNKGLNGWHFTLLS